MKNFGNNGKNISEIIEKTLNLLRIIIWSTYVQREQILDSFMIRTIHS